MAKEPKNIKFISRDQANTLKAIDEFVKNVKKGDQAMFEEFERLLFGFKATRRGIVKSVENLALIRHIRRDLDSAIKNGGYADSVKSFLASFKASSETLNGYFSTIQKDYTASAFGSQLIKESAKETGYQLVTSGVNVRYRNDVVKIIQRAVQQGATLKSTSAAIQSLVVGDAQLSRYANVVATNGLNQFSRSYISAVSDDLGLEHYFYKGTLKETSRAFCECRAGNYYTEAEVLEWGKSAHKGCGYDKKGHWSGQIKGTNESNIKAFLGGHACRHRLVPVSKKIYDLNRD